MTSRDTTAWFGIRRRLPRWHRPRQPSLREVLALGAVFGNTLLLAIYLAHFFLFDSLIQNWGFDFLKYLRVCQWAFGVPVAICVAIWLVKRLRARSDVRVPGTPDATFERLIFQLRERHALRLAETIFALTPLLLLVAHYFQWPLRPDGLAFAAPLWIGLTIQVVLRAFVRPNRFHPQAHRFEYPQWLLQLVKRERFERSISNDHAA